MVDPKDTSPGPPTVGRTLLSTDHTPSLSLGNEPKFQRSFGIENSLNPGLSLDRIGQALGAFYDDLIAEGVPEHLAALVRQVKPATPEAPLPEPLPIPPCAYKSGRLALVVEDEATTRALAESLFEPTDLKAIGCDSAEAALDILREHGDDVALVFADVRLAGAMDGLQLANAVSTLWPRTRMVVTSARPLVRPSDIPTGAVFIAKPWSPKDVLFEANRAAGEANPIIP